MTRSNIAKKIERKLSFMLGRRSIEIDPPGAIASISFDDFPASALSVGGEILKEYDCRATYFVSGSLVGTSVDGLKYCGEDDVLKAYADGHEIGCHTFDHVSCQELSNRELMENLKKNYGFLSELITVPPCTFSYPFGHISPASKKTVARQYIAARSIFSGIDCKSVDLSSIRSNAIYSKSFSETRIAALARAAQEKSGWINFYTHDVSETPSEFGCTPNELKVVMEVLKKHGVKVLPIKHALGYLGHQKRGGA